MIPAFLCMAAFAYGATADDFKKANENYAADHFAEAAQTYEGILEKDGPRVAVLNNLGSAYFKAGDIGRAILAFERALVLSPRDPDLLTNLELAQKQAAVFPVSDNNAWQAFLAGYSARRWSQLALFAGIFLPLAALVWVLMPGKRRIALAAFAVVNLVVLGVAVSAMDTKSGESARAIILGKPATVRISPFEKADNRGTLSEGREVSLGEASHGYYWVSADNGSLEGWIQKSELAPVIPREAGW